MEGHPLLKELLNICAVHNVDPGKAYSTFEVYQELSMVRKLVDLKYVFHEKLRLFYLSGKNELDDDDDIYIPVMYNDEITMKEVKTLQDILSPVQKKFYLFIRDRDSSSTCYCITQGLVKPDSPETCKRKKELEEKKYCFDKSIQANRKLIYARAFQQPKTGESSFEKLYQEK